jgi:hypothetical protein
VERSFSARRGDIVPEIVGGVLIAAFIAIYLLFLLLKLIWDGLAEWVTDLWNYLTGETARREERYRRICEAEEQFNRTILAGRYPSQEVLELAALSFHSLPEDLHRYFGEDVDYYGEAVQCVREQIRVNKERVANARDHKELAESFAELVASCSVPWDELTRIAKAMHGPHDSWPFAKYVQWNILQILSVVSEANGDVPAKLAGIYQVLAAQLEPKVYLDLADCIEKISTCKHNPLSLPLALESLRPYDQINGTNLAHKAAASYWFLVQSAVRCCVQSLPSGRIEAEYFERLKPFLSVNGTSYQSSYGGNNGSSTANHNGSCPKCIEYYPILRLKPDASEREVKTAYRDLAQIYHPDRFEEHNERVRRTAEDEMKKINEAYDHIIEHSGTNG